MWGRVGHDRLGWVCVYVTCMQRVAVSVEVYVVVRVA